MYAWDISHALVTTYHPYCHSPSALTEYLKQRLRLQRAKRLGRSLPAQVEPSVQPERNTNIHADELIQKFYKRHPKAIQNVTTQNPMLIRRTTMSTPSLVERIEGAPAPLTLAERLAESPSYIPSSPVITEDSLVPINTRPPSRAHTEPSEAEVDIGMIGCDLAMPTGFSMFDRTDPNHHHYRQKIDMPDSTSRWPHYIQFIVDTNTHNHYVYATRDNLR